MRFFCGLVSAQILAAMSVLVPGFAAAQDFPNKPVRFIVPSNPGTSSDHVARILAAEMPKSLGQPVVVENKASADNIIAYEYVAKQVPADGYALALVIVPALATLPATARSLRFDPIKDLPPLISLVETRYVFGSSSKFPWKTFNEMIANARANPGNLNQGSSAANVRLLAEVFIQDLGLNVVSIPYSGGGPFLQAMLSGEIQMGFLSEASAVGFGEKFRSLAITGQNRHPAFPDVPTFSELGYPQIRGASFSLNLPVGVPKPAIDRLYAAASRALQQSEVRERFAKVQFEIAELGPEVAARRLADEAQLYSSIAKKVGIQPQ